MLEVFTLESPWPQEKNDDNIARYMEEDMEGFRMPSRPNDNGEWVTDDVWDLMRDCYESKERRPPLEEVERRLLDAEQSRKAKQGSSN